jgi:uncharacterized protein (TIGR02145 family)
MRTVLLSLVFLFAIRYAVAQENGTFTDSRDGKVYKTVKIGTQTWMAENLAYYDGTCCAYNNDDDKVNNFGYLYTWKVATKVCPEGWHLPSDGEWAILEESLGLSERKAFKIGLRGKHAKALLYGGTSGFNAVFGGMRDNEGKFWYGSKQAFFWTSYDAGDGTSLHRGIGSKGDDVSRDFWNRRFSFSVRCISN